MKPDTETDPVAVAQAAVERALKAVDIANAQYITACRRLATAKFEHARTHPHPWNGMPVYRIMKGEGTKARIEHGVVEFKDRGTPDYGNPHIIPGSYYVLVRNKYAHQLDNSWQLELV